MAIVHDAWIFEPEEYAESMAPFAKSVADNAADGYRKLRAAVTIALGDAENGWSFAERYGGWDEASFLSQVPECYTGEPTDLAFCFTLLLYAHLSEHNRMPASFGLHTTWRNSQEALDRLGWKATDKELIVKGMDFGTFVEQYSKKLGLSPRQISANRGVWAYMGPATVGGRAGWLDRENIATFSRRLKEGAARDRKAEAEPVRTGEEEITVFRRLETMLQAADAKHGNLCLILSG